MVRSSLDQPIYELILNKWSLAGGSLYTVVYHSLIVDTLDVPTDTTTPYLENIQQVRETFNCAFSV